MTAVHSVAQVRRAEHATGDLLTNGTLMQRAAYALAVACVDLLETPAVPGSRVVLLVGSGGNGGDALWAGALLAARGCRVDAVTFGGPIHPEGAAALTRAGGRLHVKLNAELIHDADIVIDGIAGIGGNGPIRDPHLTSLLRATGATVVSVDVPSGVNADTGWADPDAVVPADLTVTFGSLKPGLLVAPGRDFSGVVQLVEIGLECDEAPVAEVIDALGIAMALPMPTEDAYKYSRGVAGIVAGSTTYRGAALLATGAAARCNLGMVQFFDRGDGNAEAVVHAVPDIVTTTQIDTNSRVNAWGIGPGLGEDVSLLLSLLATEVPIVLDADALRMCADASVQAALADRASRGRVTVMTPHVGEFAALGFEVGEDRLAAAKAAASELGVVMVLKGAGTIIAAPSGRAFIDVEGTEVLGTAGSGDVLTGIVTSFLAANQPTTLDDAARIVAAAVAVHGIAGSCAEVASGTVNSVDIMDAIGAAFASVLS